jgi:hypothetical protein
VKAPKVIEPDPVRQAAERAKAAEERARAEAKEKSAELAEAVQQDGGSKAQTRLTDGGSLREIPVLLKWSPIEGVKAYLLEIFNSKNKKLHEETVNKPQGLFRIKSLEETNYNYQISAQLPTGEKISSGQVPVHFEFSPPICKLPAMDSEIGSGKPALLIWEKTALTDYYLLQVSSDEKFDALVVEKKITKNVEPFFAPGPGTYHWRVRSVTQSKQSGWSKSFRFKTK